MSEWPGNRSGDSETENGFSWVVLAVANEKLDEITPEREKRNYCYACICGYLRILKRKSYFWIENITDSIVFMQEQRW
jgi:hypothetical protein